MIRWPPPGGVTDRLVSGGETACPLLSSGTGLPHGLPSTSNCTRPLGGAEPVSSGVTLAVNVTGSPAVIGPLSVPLFQEAVTKFVVGDWFTWYVNVPSLPE